MGRKEESEIDKFDFLWNNSADGVCIINACGKIEDVNNELCTLVGKQRNELIGHGADCMIKMITCNDSMNKNQTDFSIEDTFFIHDDRSPMLFSQNNGIIKVSKVAFNSKTGERYVLAVFHHEGKAMEGADIHTKSALLSAADPLIAKLKTLNLSKTSYINNSYEALLKQFVHYSDDVLWMMDTEFNFSFISPSVKKMRGFSVDEAMRQSLFDSLSIDSVELVRNTIDKTLVMNRKQLNEGFILQLQQICKDGSYKWIEATVRLILDDNNMIIGFIGITRDISERKRAELQTYEAKNYLNKIINNIGDPVFAKDEQYKFVLINKAFCRFFKKEKKAIINRPDYEIFSSEDCELFHKIDDKVLQTGKTFLTEEYYTDQNNKKHVLFTRKALLTDNNGKKLIVGSIRDMTQIKQADATLAKALGKEKDTNKLMADFLSMVSHEFRNPITVINSSAQLLECYLEVLNQEERSEIFERIHSSIQKVLILLDDILLLSESNTKGFMFNPEPLNSDLLLQDIIKEISQTYNSKCSIEYANRLKDKKITADKKILRQVLSNLLSNAVKYSEPGAAINVLVMQNENSFIFEIEDKGIGIEENELNKIFLPFYRGSNTEGHKGSGLGLSIVKKGVEMHSGSINISSKPGQGTRFKISIPQIHSKQENKVQ